MTIWFASGNIHKKKELYDILSGDILFGNVSGLNREIKTPSEIGLDFEPEETGNSFLENALIKARKLYSLLEGHAAWQQGDPVIADDSGLCVDALGGRPGIHSARYGGKNLDAAKKNAMLLSELGDNAQRKARFVCAMVLYFGPDRFYIAQETMEGELVKSARGKGGFGYDPVLFIPELDRTVAELSAEEKNRLSHRGKAGRAIACFLNSSLENIITPN